MIVGIVGHRHLSGSAAAFVRRESADLLARTPDPVALSALAEGADTLFAEAAVALHVPLEIVIPFDDYAGDFPTAASRRRYHALRAAARAESRLDFSHRCIDAYVAAMQWIIDRSDLLVAAWDGRPSAGAGGTGDAILRARARGLAWVHLDVLALDVVSHAA